MAVLMIIKILFKCSRRNRYSKSSKDFFKGGYGLELGKLAAGGCLKRMGSFFYHPYNTTPRTPIAPFRQSLPQRGHYRASFERQSLVSLYFRLELLICFREACKFRNVRQNDTLIVLATSAAFFSMQKKGFFPFSKAVS